MEQAIAAAERRMLMHNEERTTLRISDLYHMVPALTGKLELVYEGEQEGAINVAKHLIGKAIKQQFSNTFPNPQQHDQRRTYGEFAEKQENENEPEAFQPIMQWFAGGKSLEIADNLSNEEYQQVLRSVTGLADCIEKYADFKSESEQLVLMEWVIEGLHQYSKLGKEDLDEVRSYTDMVGSVLGGLGEFDDPEDLDEF
jgi:magnesium chelatase subunit I